MHIIHGMAEHGGRYARLASALNTAGFIVWAHDHRGHGGNPTSPVGLGHFADVNGWRALVDDSWAVSAHMRATHPGLPTVLFAPDETLPAELDGSMFPKFKPAKPPTILDAPLPETLQLAVESVILSTLLPTKPPRSLFEVPLTAPAAVDCKIWE